MQLALWKSLSGFSVRRILLLLISINLFCGCSSTHRFLEPMEPVLSFEDPIQVKERLDTCKILKDNWIYLYHSHGDLLPQSYSPNLITTFDKALWGQIELDVAYIYEIVGKSVLKKTVYPELTKGALNYLMEEMILLDICEPHSLGDHSAQVISSLIDWCVQYYKTGDFPRKVYESEVRRFLSSQEDAIRYTAQGYANLITYKVYLFDKLQIMELLRSKYSDVMSPEEFEVKFKIVCPNPNNR